MLRARRRRLPRAAPLHDVRALLDTRRPRSSPRSATAPPSTGGNRHDLLRDGRGPPAVVPASNGHSTGSCSSPKRLVAAGTMPCPGHLRRSARRCSSGCSSATPRSGLTPAAGSVGAAYFLIRRLQEERRLQDESQEKLPPAQGRSKSFVARDPRARAASRARAVRAWARRPCRCASTRPRSSPGPSHDSLQRFACMAETTISVRSARFQAPRAGRNEVAWRRTDQVRALESPMTLFETTRDAARGTDGRRRRKEAHARANMERAAEAGRRG